MGWTTGVRFSAGAGIFPLLHSLHAHSGAYLASYRMGSGGLSLGMKQPELESDYSPPSSAEVKNGWRYTYRIPQFFMALCLVKQ